MHTLQHSQLTAQRTVKLIAHRASRHTPLVPRGLGRDVLLSLNREQWEALSDKAVEFEALTISRDPERFIKSSAILRQVDANAQLLDKKRVNIRALMLREPRLFFLELRAFEICLMELGFDNAGVEYLLSQAPEAVVKATLVSIGSNFLLLRSLGIDEQLARQLMLVHPQLLYMNEADCAGLVSLLAKFSGNGAC